MFRKACLPDIRYKDTKNGKSLDRIYKKVSIKYRNKKPRKLFPSDKVAAEDWTYVTEKCKEALAYIAEARK